MEEIVEQDTGEEEVGEDATPLPTQMQLLSTWEVKRMPHNCVTRLCTLTVTRLQVKQSLEPSLPSLVVAVSMKTPHRFLRSNELPLPASGTLDISLQLTFSLQYPHFLKRGGNILQIRVQRRKRYRNHPLGGYKTLAMGTVEMSQVLQAGYAGEVQLFSGKPPLPLALVTVGSLTSTPVYMEPQREGSSDEEEDDIAFSDYRASDSDSGEGTEVYRHTTHSHKLKSKTAKPSSRMLRLLGIKGGSKNPTEVDELLDLQGEDPESAVTFASSVSDSEEDEEGMAGPSTPPRPTLSPFFGSDRCSMVSIPNSVRSAEVGTEVTQQPPAALPTALKKYGSLEEAIKTGLKTEQEKVPAVSSDVDLVKRRVWVVAEEGMSTALAQAEEAVIGREEKGREEIISKLQLQLDSMSNREDTVFVVAVVGEDWLVSAALQAVLQVTSTTETPNSLLRMVVIPTCAGVVASRLLLLDEGTSLPLDTDWHQITAAPLQIYVDAALHTHSIPVAHVVLHRPAATELPSGTASQEPAPLHFIFSISVGSVDAEWEQLQPTSPPSASSGSEVTELVVEYLTGKKEKEKSSLKVRCVTATCDGQALNVTTLSRDKRGKGIRIRKKEKEGETAGSIVSLSTTQFLCRPSNKQDTLSVVVDGVEWTEVSSVRVVANVGQCVTIATNKPSQTSTETHTTN